jgi:hypothetical protein
MRSRTPDVSSHAPAMTMLSVLAIYQAGIDEGDATFETAAPTWETFDAEKLPEHRLVALDEGGGRVLGWVAVARASNWHLSENTAAARADPGRHAGGSRGRCGWCGLGVRPGRAVGSGMQVVEAPHVVLDRQGVNTGIAGDQLRNRLA